MVEPGEALSESDLERVARLHLAGIDDSLPSLLGPRYPLHFYRFVVASDREWLFVERVDGKVESACVLSFEPRSVGSRIVRATLPWLARDAALALLQRRDFRSFLVRSLGEIIGGGGGEPDAPKLNYLFTNEALRGGGLGRPASSYRRLNLAESPPLRSVSLPWSYRPSPTIAA